MSKNICEMSFGDLFYLMAFIAVLNNVIFFAVAIFLYSSGILRDIILG